MIDLRADGTITIDFDDPTGQVTIRPPKYGAFKRLRHERERLAEQMAEALAALPILDSLPAAGDQSEGAQDIRARLTPAYRARLAESQDLVADTLAATWRLIFLGHGDDFAGLATPAPPESADEWPAELLVDAGEIEIVNGQPTRTNDTLLDAVFKHWGKARYRSGPTAPLPL